MFDGVRVSLTRHRSLTLWRFGRFFLKAQIHPVSDDVFAPAVDGLLV